MNHKQKIASEILLKSIELLTPLANDVKGIHHPEQKKCLYAISKGINAVVSIDVTANDEMEALLKRIEDYTVEYKP